MWMDNTLGVLADIEAKAQNLKHRRRAIRAAGMSIHQSSAPVRIEANVEWAPSFRHMLLLPFCHSAAVFNWVEKRHQLKSIPDSAPDVLVSRASL